MQSADRMPVMARACSRMGTWRHDGASPPGRAGARVAQVALRPVLVLALILAQSLPSAADEEETEEGRLLVLQAVSLIANRATPETIAERIEDAVEAPDPRGVDLDNVEEALALVQGALDDPQVLEEARGLLETSVKIRAASGYGSIPGPGEVGTDTSPYATGTATGTTVVLNSLDPALGISDTGDVVLLVLAAGTIVLGVYLARRWRPAHSMRELRQVRES